MRTLAPCPDGSASTATASRPPSNGKVEVAAVGGSVGVGLDAGVLLVPPLVLHPAKSATSRNAAPSTEAAEGARFVSIAIVLISYRNVKAMRA